MPRNPQRLVRHLCTLRVARARTPKTRNETSCRGLSNSRHRLVVRSSLHAGGRLGHWRHSLDDRCDGLSSIPLDQPIFSLKSQTRQTRPAVKYGWPPQHHELAEIVHQDAGVVNSLAAGHGGASRRPGQDPSTRSLATTSPAWPLAAGSASPVPPAADRLATLTPSAPRPGRPRAGGTDAIAAGMDANHGRGMDAPSSVTGPTTGNGGPRRAECGSGPPPRRARAGTMPDRAMDISQATALPHARVWRSEQDAIPRSNRRKDEG